MRDPVQTKDIEPLCGWLLPWPDRRIGILSRRCTRDFRRVGTGLSLQLDGSPEPATPDRYHGFVAGETTPAKRRWVPRTNKMNEHDQTLAT